MNDSRNMEDVEKEDKFKQVKGIIDSKINANDKKSNTYLFYRANKAIKEAVKLAKSLVLAGLYDNLTVMSQDQGHWIGYKRAARDLNVNYTEISTEDGVVDPSVLKSEFDKVEDELIIFFMTQPAAYSFVQDAQDIYSEIKSFNQQNLDEGKRKKVIFVMDVSGSFSNLNQADFDNCDIMMASFAASKVVDYGYGGFLTVRKEIIDEVYEKSRFETEEGRDKRVNGILLENFEEKHLNGMIEALNSVEQRLQERYGLAAKIKEDLLIRGFRPVNKDSLGVNVIVEAKDEAEQKRIIEFCDEIGYEYKECPLDIKIKRLGVSIQLGMPKEK